MLLFLLFYGVISAFVIGTETVTNNTAYCFNYRWKIPTIEDCNGKPCIDPLVNTTDLLPPNTDEMWSSIIQDVNDNNTITIVDSPFLCAMLPKGVCISYTYIYNSAVVHYTAKFCGIMSEGDVALSSGCYSQDRDGYQVEVCACQSAPGGLQKPCNSAVQLQYSVTSILVSLISFLAYTNT